MMVRPRRELAVTNCAQFPAQRLHRYQNTELLPQPLPEISVLPAHNTLDRWYRAAVNPHGIGRLDRGALRRAHYASGRPTRFYQT